MLAREVGCVHGVMACALQSWRMTEGRTVSLNASPRQGRGVTKNCRKNSWECSKPFKPGCQHHDESVTVPCGRWRTCRGCALRKQWELKQRFIAGIEQVPEGRLPMLLTLTFSANAAPDETEADRCWRKLVAKFDYMGYLGAYGWVLQRTKRGTLHYHGIAHLPWFDDELAEWRRMVTESGFGVQNKLVLADARHAGYVGCYISTGLASLAPLRRAYGFSRDFPKTAYAERQALLAARAGEAPAVEATDAKLAELAARFGRTVRRVLLGAVGGNRAQRCRRHHTDLQRNTDVRGHAWG